MSENCRIQRQMQDNRMIHAEFSGFKVLIVSGDINVLRIYRGYGPRCSNIQLNADKKEFIIFVSKTQCEWLKTFLPINILGESKLSKHVQNVSKCRTSEGFDST